MLVECANVRQRHRRWTPAAIVYLTNFAIFAQMGKQQVNLFVESVKISLNAFRFRHRHRVAATIVAQVLAKRHMDVERDVVCRSIVGGFDGLQILRCIEVHEMICRGIACVARHRYVIFLEYRFVHSSFLVAFI